MPLVNHVISLWIRRKIKILSGLTLPPAPKFSNNLNREKIFNLRRDNMLQNILYKISTIGWCFSHTSKKEGKKREMLKEKALSS